METQFTEFAEKHQLTAEFKFVPFSKSRNKNEKHKTINWEVTLKTPRGEMTVDYAQGIGHLSDFNHAKSKLVWYVERIDHAVEHGHWNNKFSDYVPFYTKGKKNIPDPNLMSVFHSLITDSEVLNYGCFEDWAENFGYDTDSREAEKIYQACLKIALKLSNIMGKNWEEEAQEILADY